MLLCLIKWMSKTLWQLSQIDPFLDNRPASLY